MASDNEVKVVATMDTTDVNNGVQRIKTAVSGMGKEIEGASKETGETSGAAFSNAFIKRLVIRDAIYAVIRGIGDATKEAITNMQELAGIKPDNLSLWQEFTHAIGDAVSGIVTLSPYFKNASVGLAQAGVSATNAQNQRAEALENFREDPNSLKTPTSQLEGQLRDIIAQRAAIKLETAQRNVTRAAGGQASFGRDDDARDAAEDRRLSGTEQFLREMVGIAKGRDRSSARGGSKEDSQSDRAAESVETANENMRGYEREEDAKNAREAEEATHKSEEAAAKAQREAAEAAKQAAEKKKRDESHALGTDIRDDSGAVRGANSDLRFSEEQLGHQKATSAVRIGGGLFGKNDSAAALVQHAAQQVSLLRSIDDNLKQMRQQRADLTIE